MLLSIDLAALRCRLMEAISSGVSPLEVFKEMGIDPSDPTVLQKMMDQVGIDLGSLVPEGQADMGSLVNSFMDNLSTESKQQFSELIENIASGAGGDSSLPEGIQDFLKNRPKT